ncbi:hypothetical protein ACIXBP_18685 [Bacteroides fragilis]
MAVRREGQDSPGCCQDGDISGHGYIDSFIIGIMTYQAAEIVIYKTAILCKRDIHIQDSHIVWGIYLASARIDRLTVD